MSERKTTMRSVPPPGGEAAFSNPWQARAFALAVALNEAGHLDWPAWTRLLGEEIANQGGNAGDGEDAYYRCWVAALEKASAAIPKPR